MEKFTITLKTVTPVHVWSGNNILPNEYYLDLTTNTFYRIDFVKLSRHLSIHQINVLTQTLSKAGALTGDIQKIIQRYLDEVMLYNIKINKEIVTPLSKTSEPIMEQLRINGIPTIPASSIKGLFRTALMYYFIKKDRQLFDKVCNSIEESISNLLIEISSKNFRQIRKKIKNLAKNTETQTFKYWVKLNKYYLADIMQFLIISDPIIHNVNCTIGSIELYENGKVLAHQLVEIISENSKFIYKGYIKSKEYNMKNRKYDSYMKFLEKSKKITLDILRKALLNYSKDILERDSKRYERIVGMKDTLLKSLREKCNEDKVYVRMGYGTGILWKTILGLVQERRIELYNKLCKIMNNIYGKIWDLKTFKLVEPWKLPIGVVEISIKEV